MIVLLNIETKRRAFRTAERFDNKSYEGNNNLIVEKEHNLLSRYVSCLSEEAWGIASSMEPNREFREGGDDGYDFMFHVDGQPKTIDVKASDGRGKNWKRFRLPGATMDPDKLTCDFYVFAIVQADHVNFRGWITGEDFRAKGSVQLLRGYTWAIGQQFLQPVETLIGFIRSSRRLAGG